MSKERASGIGETAANGARATTEYLDGLRGVLIVAIMSAHCFLLTTSDWYSAQGHRIGPYPWYFQTVRWFFPFFFSVSPFVVVSGYCLMLPIVRSKEGTFKSGVGDYFLRRARRILPPYYAAVLLTLLHLTFLRSDYQGRVPWDDPWTAGNLISHVFVFYNLSDVWRYGINGAYWSLAPEWQLYILFPLVLVPLWRWSGAGGLLAVVFCASVALMLGGAAICRMHPWFLFLFSIGIFVAEVTEAKGGRLVELRERVPWGLVGSLIFAAMIVAWGELLLTNSLTLDELPIDWRTYALNEVLVGLATGAAVIHWTVMRRTQPRERWPKVLRFLDHAKVRRIGEFSFSLYLLHFPILVSMSALVVRLKLGAVATLIVSYLVSIPAVFLLSYVFFLAVERRCLSVRRVVPSEL